MHHYTLANNGPYGSSTSINCGNIELVLAKDTFIRMHKKWWKSVIKKT